MNKFQRSWVLLKTSLSVIARNKVLLVFPIVTFICTVVIALFFLAPPLLRPTGYSYASAEHWAAISHSLFTSSSTSHHPDQVTFSRGAVAYGVFLYFGAMFVATFFNVAFYHEILNALGGQPVSLGRGLKFAFTKLPAIFMWTLFAGLVGLIIKLIEERLEVVGRLIAGLLGLAWSITAVFAIPVIVREQHGLNPIAMLQSSAGCIKRTWGEALIGYVGLSFANSLIFLGSLVFLGGAVAASVALNNFWILAVVGPLWLLSLFTWSYFTSVASQVYKGALYLYAAEGFIAEPYSQELLDTAWKYKKA
jgi:hypothetical protein